MCLVWAAVFVKLPLPERLFTWSFLNNFPGHITLIGEYRHCRMGKRQSRLGGRSTCQVCFCCYLLTLFVIQGTSLTPLLWTLPCSSDPSMQIHKACCRDPKGPESCFSMEVFRESIRKWGEVKLQELENIASVTLQLKYADWGHLDIFLSTLPVCLSNPTQAV